MVYPALRRHLNMHNPHKILRANYRSYFLGFLIICICFTNVLIFSLNCSTNIKWLHVAYIKFLLTCYLFADTCEQEMDEGPCRGSFERWYYDKNSKSCQRFRFGGCKGNSNNFISESACQQKCATKEALQGIRKNLCILIRNFSNTYSFYF